MDDHVSAPGDHDGTGFRVVSTREALADGLSRSAVDRRLQSGAWQQLLHGVYLVNGPGTHVDWADLDFRTRVDAAVLLHGGDAVASHATAVALHGLPGRARRDLDVHLTLPADRARHQRSGIVLHFRRLPPHEAVVAAGVRCTSVERTLADVLCTWGEWDSVSVLDAALAAGLVLPPDLAAVAATLPRRRGAVDARRRLQMGDGRSQSPLETRVRLIASEAGFRPDHVQMPVRSARGQLLGIADMAWHKPDGRILVAEADGHRWHDSPAALFRDRHRANDFTGTGDIDMVRFTWEDTRRPAYIRTVLRGHLDPS